MSKVVTTNIKCCEECPFMNFHNECIKTDEYRTIPGDCFSGLPDWCPLPDAKEEDNGNK